MEPTGTLHHGRGDPLLVLIGGASGVGKSRLAQALAIATASTVSQIDDLQTAIETLVPPDRLPEYFLPSTTYLRTDSPGAINDAIEQVAAFFAPAIHAAIANRVESGTATVFEGDFLSPDVAAQARDLGVRSIFLHADDAEIRANFRQRDGDEQAGRARVCALHSSRNVHRCAALGIPVVRALPYETLLPRARAALDLPPLDEQG